MFKCLDWKLLNKLFQASYKDVILMFLTALVDNMDWSYFQRIRFSDILSSEYIVFVSCETQAYRDDLNMATYRAASSSFEEPPGGHFLYHKCDQSGMGLAKTDLVVFWKWSWCMVSGQ